MSSSETSSQIGMIENTPGRSSTSSCKRIRPLPAFTSRRTSFLKLSSILSTTAVVTPVALVYLSLLYFKAMKILTRRSREACRQVEAHGVYLRHI